MPKELNDGWISVGEVPLDTPILAGSVDTVVSAKVVSINGTRYLTGHGFGGYNIEMDFTYEQMIGWQPLPNPPKEVNK